MQNKSDILVREQARSITIILILLIALLVSILFSFILGRYGIALDSLFGVLISSITGAANQLEEMVQIIVVNIRLPRIAAAVMIGAALSMSGAAYQGTFKNPMVSPDILGASAGAAFGAALGLLLGVGIFGVQVMSFLFGLLAVFLTYSIGKIVARGDSATLVLVLAGMVISTLFSSFISIIKYVADPYTQLAEITFWLMGGLSTINNDDVKLIILPMLLGFVPLMLVRWRINVLSLGEEEALALGVNTTALRVVVIVSATMLTASSVSIGGQIGWVGLVIPHLSRMLVGPNYKYLMPTTFLLGATYLLLVDDVARNLFPMEVPLGILTSIIGAPFFIALMLKGKRGWM